MTFVTRFKLASVTFLSSSYCN